MSSENPPNIDAKQQKPPDIMDLQVHDLVLLLRALRPTHGYALQKEINPKEVGNGRVYRRARFFSKENVGWFMRTKATGKSDGPKRTYNYQTTTQGLEAVEKAIAMIAIAAEEPTWENIPLPGLEPENNKV